MADIDPVIPYFAGLVFDCEDPVALAHWWAQLLDTEVVSESPEYCAVRPPEGRKTGIAFQKVPEGKHGKNRAHPDLVVGDKDAAATRALDMGATRLDSHSWEGGWTWSVMQDPEGNEFCLVQPPPQPETGDE